MATPTGREPEAVGRRRQRKAPDARREDIVRAAVRLFTDRGADSTTVQDIAREADMAAGTVYLYFPSKDDVLAECHRRLRSGMANAMAAAATEQLDESTDGPARLPRAVSAMVDAAADFALANRELCAVCLKYAPRAVPIDSDRFGLISALSDLLDRGQAAGLVEVRDPAATAHLLGSAIGVSICGAVVFGSPPLDRVLLAARELVERAIGPR